MIECGYERKGERVKGRRRRRRDVSGRREVGWKEGVGWKSEQAD